MRISALLGLVALASLSLSLYAEQPITGPRGLAAWHALVNFEELANQRSLAPVKAPRAMPLPDNLRSRQPVALQRGLESLASSTSAPSQPSPAPTTSSLAADDNDTHRRTLPLPRRARGVATRHALVNFEELANQRSLAPVKAPRVMPLPDNLRNRQPVALQRGLESLASSTSAPFQPSPEPTTSFLAVGDNNTAIPPDTMGAVGPNHVMTTLNSQVRIQTKAGTILRTWSLDEFWSSVGSPDVYDPRIAYDSFNNRWIFSGVANANLPSASIVIGVSSTSDPTADWFLYSVDVDTNGNLWADYDYLGFNKDWVVVSANVFTNGATGGFDSVGLWVFDKSDLYTNGPAVFTLLKMQPSTQAFSVAPAQTHDNSLATMYLVEEWDGSFGQLRVSTITGPVGSESLTVGTAYPTVTNLWETYNIPDNLGQQLGINQGIDLGDTRVLTCRYRDGSLWVSQNALLPLNTPTRCAAQWWQFRPDGMVEQFGRVDDPTGVFMYAFPSLAVNVYGDVLIGYNRFSSSQYVSANYSFRFSTDPPGTLRADTVLKDGEGSYYNAVDGLNRWGDYSATAVDPADDLTLWTIQEYAALGSSWGTWWGRIVPSNVALIRPSNGMSYPPSPTVTLSAIRLNTDLDFTKIEFFADTTKIGETNTNPFTITWNPSNTGTFALTAVATDTLSGVSTSAIVNIFVGDLKSPVGTWQTKLRRAGKGNAVVEFADDNTIIGHGLSLGTYGIFSITGSWAFNAKHQITGSYSEQLNATPVFTGTILGKVANAKKLSATVKPFTLTPALKLGGIPVAPVPDISGTYTGITIVARTKSTVTCVFTPSAALLNVFDLVVQETNQTLTGSVIVTASGALTAVTTNGTLSSLAGAFKLPGKITLKGKNSLGTAISVKVTRE